MKTTAILITGAVLCLAIPIHIGCSSPKQQALVEPREVWQFASVTAAVEAVDLQKRELALRGPLGNVITFTVDERVRRLNEIKVGDEVVADYYVSLATEIRDPTAEETESPLTLVAAAGKAPFGIPPGVGGVSQIRAVVAVVGIARPAQTVMVRGPLGRYVAARVADPARLQGLQLGDTIVVTYTEAVAISVEKVK
jgi:hypothetical protein